MRLRRLNLTAFGKFSGESIDFGEAVPGQPDLHIIYGPNEAGKSTALAAFMDLLFGIEQQTRFDFLHDYSTMCVGGQLELSVGTRDLVRRKKPSPTLRDLAGNPVPEGLIQGDLAGIDRAAYRTMFLLDDDTIEAGGKSILASGGQLGELLFSASAGLAEMSKQLTELRSQADRFVKPNSRSGELQELKTKLAELVRDRNALNTVASEYNRLNSTKIEAKRKYDNAVEEQRDTRKKLGSVRRLLAGLPHMGRLRHLREHLEGFANLPEAPPEWLGQLPQLQSNENQLREEMAVATADAERLAQELDATEVDEAAFSKIGRLQHLENLKAGFVRAERDLPNVRNEVAQNDVILRQLLTRLERADEADPAKLLLPDSQITVLGRLIESRPSIAEKVSSAQVELSKANMTLTAAQHRLGENPISTDARYSPILLPVINAMSQSDHLLRLQAAEKKKIQWSNTLEGRMAKLAPWSGTPDELGRLSVPTETIFRELSNKAQRNQVKVEQLQADLENAAHEVNAADAELQIVSAIPGVVDDQDASRVRDSRDAAWTAHRALLSNESADTFERAMHLDDDVISRRFSHAQELAALHERKRTLALAQSKAREIRAKLDEAKATHQAGLDEFTRQAAAVSSNLAEMLTPAAFLAWRDDWRQAREALENVRDAEAELAAALDDAHVLRRRLVAALQHVQINFDPDDALEDLMMVATDAMATETRLEALRKDVTTAELEVQTRTHALGIASQADRSWQTAWRAACKACWLGETASEAPIEVVRDILVTLNTLGHTLSARATLVGRIDGMGADQAAFIAEVTKLAHEIGLDPDSISVLDCATAIESKINQAKKASQTCQRLEAELSTARIRRRKAETRQQEYVKQTEAMMTHMQVETLIELSIKLQQSQNKVQLQSDIAQALLVALAALQADDVEAADAMLKGATVDNLDAEQASLSTTLETLEANVIRLHEASILANDRLDSVGGDDGVARLEERRRTVLLEIQDKAEKYFRLRVGIVAAERALRSYRDDHRSSMMQNASTAFATITKGAYQKLTTQPEKDDEVLVAVSANGASKLATQLSKGTRFQLYLALRAAGYHELASIWPPVPFIADDIMETFDNPRSEETFRVFENMARRGQVIYMTHHDHLRQMAEQTIPGVRVHIL
jgi:uncharacterized protein YhaN